MLLNEDLGFRREFFLLDTGSPISIIVDDIVRNHNVHVSGMYHSDYMIDVEGVVTTFQAQPKNSGDARTQNINLLGTNFINHFVLVDDYFSKTILLLKRASIPRISL